MHDPLVTITNFMLTIQCAVFAWYLRHVPIGVSYFVVLGLAALLGGLVHGFAPDSQLLWGATLLTLGLAAVTSYLLALWAAGGSSRYFMPLRAGLALVYLGYAAWIILIDRVFLVAILFYLPAMLILLAVCVWRRLWWGSAGVGLTLMASALQAAHVSLLGLHHNTLYHLVLMGAGYGLYRFIREVAQARTSRP